ncbi:MAG TPA: cytochrome c maturation protein CcmE [candidate division Zixibacteria bacterium]|nr:cytochrome c maturation protein CcmE [candidate division Zixibacteria bacterium]
MAQATWTTEEAEITKPKKNRTKFIVGGALMAAAIIFLVVNAVSGNTQLYVTVDEYYSQQAAIAGRDLRISGWVIGDSIQYTQIDDATSRLEFDITDDLADPTRQKIRVVVMNEPIPDLLQHEAQALVEGHVENGEFIANPNGLLLKCPTRYEEADPAQAY